MESSMNIPQPFPYQGSKRRIAPEIVALLPEDIDRLVEPFVGSGAVSLRAAHANKARRFLFNDINAPLIALWDSIINTPDEIARQYEKLWQAQQGREKVFYFLIRDKFNQTPRPDYLLYLLARCVKAAIRYNANGEFNQSPDNRRQGMHPDRMGENIRRTARLLEGRVQLSAHDYRAVLEQAQPSDVIYMDPPYQGVCKKQDPRYLQGLAFDEFVETLRELIARDIPFMVSYDGRTGTKAYGEPLPESLNLARIEINAGTSTQETLLGRRQTTFESLYLSSTLAARLEDQPRNVQQLALW
jgi:DNA adenine methylase